MKTLAPGFESTLNSISMMENLNILSTGGFWKIITKRCSLFVQYMLKFISLRCTRQQMWKPSSQPNCYFNVSLKLTWKLHKFTIFWSKLNVTHRFISMTLYEIDALDLDVCFSCVESVFSLFIYCCCVFYCQNDSLNILLPCHFEPFQWANWQIVIQSK